MRGNLTGNVCNPRFYNATKLEVMTGKALKSLIAKPALVANAVRTYEKRLAPVDRAAERSAIEQALEALSKEE